MTTVQASRRDNYAKQWLLLVVFVLAGMGAWHVIAQRPAFYSVKVPEAASGQGTDWFLLMKIPDVSSQPMEQQVAKERFVGWLRGLRREGFHPMLLSAVLSRLDRGALLPPKTVVLLFHPAYRSTYETFAPLLADVGWPAVLLTDRDALRRGDRRYLSNHAMRRVKRSPLWDIGWYQGAPKAERVMFELTSSSHAGKRHRLSLNLAMDHEALNRVPATRGFSRLAIHPTWTTDELIDRLLAEAPVEGPAHLTVRTVGSRTVGVALDAGQSDQHPFRLEAPADARAASVAWLCTRGKHDLLLHLKALSCFGQLWIRLRSDPASGQGVRIGFTPEGIVVQQDQQQVHTQLAAVPWPALPNGPMAVTILLRGQRLHLAVNDQTLCAVDSIRPPVESYGLVELLVHDKVRGAAAMYVADVIFVPVDASRQTQPALRATQYARS